MSDVDPWAGWTNVTPIRAVDAAWPPHYFVPELVADWLEARGESGWFVRYSRPWTVRILGQDYVVERGEGGGWAASRCAPNVAEGLPRSPQ